MSSLELHLTPDHDIQLNNAASLAQPGGSESGQGRNTTTPSHAESLLAEEKRTLEMMANGAIRHRIYRPRTPDPLVLNFMNS